MGHQPSAVARMVEQGIREKRLHIFTDQQFLPAFEARAQTIVESFKKAQ
jgi:hypothetical protein